MNKDVKSLLRLALLFVLLGGLFQLLSRSVLGTGQQSDFSSWQYYFSPLVFGILFFLRPRYFQLSRGLLLFAGVAVLLSLNAYYLVYSADSAIVVSRFNGDAFSAQTRVFKNRMDMALERSMPLDIARSDRLFSSLRQVAEFRRDHPEVQILVWGDPQVYNLSFLQRPTMLFDLEGSTSPQSVESIFLQPIHTVSGFQITAQPSTATFPFLAELLVGLSFSREELLKSPDLRELRRSHLLSAASWQGAWANHSHKAFAYLILGNDYLFEALQSKELDMGELDCALQSFEQGMSFLSANEAPETRAALLNNKGYLLALKGALLSQKRELKRAKAHFKAARKLSAYPDPLAIGELSANTASKNLRRLKKIRKLLAGKNKLQLKKRRKGQQVSGSQKMQRSL